VSCLSIGKDAFAFGTKTKGMNVVALYSKTNHAPITKHSLHGATPTCVGIVTTGGETRAVSGDMKGTIVFSPKEGDVLPAPKIRGRSGPWGHVRSVQGFLQGIRDVAIDGDLVCISAFGKLSAINLRTHEKKQSELGYLTPEGLALCSAMDAVTYHTTNDVHYHSSLHDVSSYFAARNCGALVGGLPLLVDATDETLHCVNVSSGEELWSCTFTDDIRRIAVGLDPNKCALLVGDDLLHYDCMSKKDTLLATLPSFPNEMVCDPTGTMVAISIDRRVWVYSERAPIAIDLRFSVTHLGFGGNDRLLIAGCDEISVWHISQSQTKPEMQITQPISACGISTTGRDLVFTMRETPTVFVWTRDADTSG